ncbi:class I SAM-dependent methyltransferase [Paucibacter sp. APW11]|uniref:Class I SAM-dependent methyltransferase n=1 Tax=Roseateles aquae TaxID=3077235 RepID=A0ABU3PAE3_9BURK|nr:class I SAM-dependent methyltransferase [Paucibacter sp. APW11]MDT8999493.1 class I SAM-dependent methyltransferase [Paucibacter sp. APW11]
MPAAHLAPLFDAIARLQAGEDVGRLFHGRGGLYPGCEHLALDVFPPVVMLTSFEPLDEALLAEIGVALQARWQGLAQAQPLSWVYQCRHEGQSETRLMAGAVPEPHWVQEDGARYQVHLLRGQNHGLFLDMAAGRRWVRAQAQAQPGIKVLNLFAYTCAFSVAALRGGASQVVNLDMASGALSIGRRNHEANGEHGLKGASYLAHDLFTSWGKLIRGGPYELVIADPPSYQKGSFVATKDYARLLRRLPELLAPGGQVLLALNTPKLTEAFLREQVAEHAPSLQFIERLANPPAFADADPDRALKVLVYRAGPQAGADGEPAVNEGEKP